MKYSRIATEAAQSFFSRKPLTSAKNFTRVVVGRIFTTYYLREHKIAQLHNNSGHIQIRIPYKEMQTIFLLGRLRPLLSQFGAKIKPVGTVWFLVSSDKEETPLAPLKWYTVPAEEKKNKTTYYGCPAGWKVRR